MKKLIYMGMILAISIALVACVEKSFSISDLKMSFTNISVSDGTTGNSVVLDKEQSEELYNQWKDIRFVKEKSSKDYTGWSYSLKFLNGDKEIKEFGIMSQDTIEYEGYFYESKEVRMNMEYLESLFNATFQAVVIKDGTDLIVTPDQDSNEASSADKIAVRTKGAVILNENKQEINIENLKAGDIVKITYNGVIMESYPAQIAADVIEVQETSRLIEGYLAIIDEIYQEDSGLNSDISMMAIDTSELNGLSSWEKQILLSAMKSKYGMEVIEGTYEELVEEDLIDGENLYFPEGILITITNTKFNEKKESLTYEIKKWRSGLGAIGYHGTAEYKDGVWRISKENMWIS